MKLTMVKLVHFLTLLSMLCMFWASTPSVATTCMPGTDINACCSAGTCDTDMACLCCDLGTSNSDLANNGQAVESKLPVLLPPSKQPPVSLPTWTLSPEQVASALVKPVFGTAAQPAKLYLVNRSLLI
jgi:hypothetical protein